MVLSCWYQTILTTLYCWSHDKHCMWNENQRGKSKSKGKGKKGKVKKCRIPQIVQLNKLLKVTALIMKRKIVFCELLQHVNQIKIVNKAPQKTMKRWMVQSSRERHREQCQYLSNYAPTPPLTQQQSTDNKQRLMSG